MLIFPIKPSLTRQMGSKRADPSGSDRGAQIRIIRRGVSQLCFGKRGVKKAAGIAVIALRK